jgi:hypothetical protein
MLAELTVIIRGLSHLTPTSLGVILADFHQY